MLSPRQKKTGLLLLPLLAGAALRLWFIRAYPEIGGDTLVYGGIAKNWMLHGVYGVFSPEEGLHPTLMRLPGYPLFLRLCFHLFGIERYYPIMLIQALIGLLSCLLIAGFARRVWSDRAGWWALWLAALCPFTANYTAAPLTETLELFCIALAFYALPRFLDAPGWKWALVLAAAWSYAALLRPDGPLLALALCPAMVFYGRRRWGAARMVRWATLCGALSILPFIPWTIRNWETFHVFQPLAPRYAVDPGESTDPGFNRWTKTVCADFACTWDVYWNANSDAIDPSRLPARAFDSEAQYRQTVKLLDAYNDELEITLPMDADFAALAAQRIRAHPFRYYLELPLARLADMWLRPRTEMLWIEVRWWQFEEHEGETEFAWAYAGLNLAYLLAALAGFLKRPSFRAAIFVFVLLRCLLLLTLEAPEPRYTLECFPSLIALAAIAFAGRAREPEPCAPPAHAQSSP
ncbi:MAG TPA: glycosyltransferase family 39 protein [Acidobacteriaceae bacterium]|nr:glycosyltransferase family 39 protein [Acidobacteriaceae bacterium]